MILKALISGFLTFFLGPFSIIGFFIDLNNPPSFYFDWVDDVEPYFECLRYIIPMEGLIPLFVAIISITGVRVVIALIKMIFGKIVPIW